MLMDDYETLVRPAKLREITTALKYFALIAADWKS